MATIQRSLSAGGLLAVLTLVLAGCSHTATYNPAYIAGARHATGAPQAEGTVLIHASEEDTRYVFTGHPTSFTGGASTLSLGLGMITREAAKTAFGDAFKGGARVVSDLKEGDSAAVIVHPKVTNFSYEYNALKNLGFAITPTVRTTLLVQVLQQDGTVKSESTYDSGTTEAPAYIVSLEPNEKVNELSHRTIYDLMVKAATDLVAKLGLSPPSR